MNKKVMYYDGKVLVEDENGNEREVVSCDNLDDILVQENLIETIQNVINALEYSSSSFLKNRVRDILCIPMPVIETVLVPSIMMYMTNIPNNSIVDGMIQTKFGLMDKEKFLAIFIAVFLPYGLGKTKKWYKEYKDEKRCESGRILTIRELKNNLLAHKNRLIEMEKASMPIEMDEKSYRVNDEEALEILHEYITLYYDIGYNLKTYCRYYKKYGDVPEYFKQEYNKEGIKLMREILEKNCKSLVKKGKDKHKK